MKHPNTEQAHSSETSRAACLVVIVAAICLAASPGGAETLDDWKSAQSAANSGKGPESIPYSSYRDEAKNKQALVDEFCKKDSWSCDGLETKSLRQEIKGRSYKIEETKKEQDKLKSEKSTAKTDDEKRKIQDKIDALTKEIDKQSRELEFKQKSLETDIKDIDIRIGKGAKCLEARTSVQSAFKNAIDKAKGENDPAIKAIASQLISYWEKRQQEHQKASDDTKAGMEKCRKCKEGDL